MRAFVTSIKVNLQAGLRRIRTEDIMMSGDALANRIEVELTDGAQRVTLEPGTDAVSAYVIRNDNDTVVIMGSVADGKAVVELPSSCYAVLGPVSIAIRLTRGGTKTVIAILDSYVRRTTTDTIIDPGHVVPSLEDLLAKIGLMDQKTAEAIAAAQSANTAAAAANTAVQTANTTARKIDNMTVEATGLPEGSSPTVQISEVSGHKHIRFGLVKGDKGKDFHISFTFPSIAAMEAYSGEIELYDYAMIDTGSVEDADTGKLYCYEADETWHYIGDLSGAQGIRGPQGETGNGIQSVALNNDYTLTINFTDGSSYTTPAIRGAKGETGATGATGNGIAGVVMNADYTLTVSFTDGTSYTTPISIRGAQGIQGNTGNGISGIVQNADYTLTVNFTDGSSWTTPTPVRGAIGATGDRGPTGPTGNGIASAVLNADYTLTINFTDGTSYTTPISIRGATGDTGATGATGATPNFSIGNVAGGSQAGATITGTAENPVLNLVLPKGDKGDTGNNGKDFRIKKTFASIAAMQAYDPDTDPIKMEENDFAMIDTGSAEDADTGKLYCYEPDNTPVWRYIGDLSGARGIKGETGAKGDKGTGISGAVLNQDYTLTITFEDGTSYTTPVSIRGATGAAGAPGSTGATGNGIQSAVLNGDYTLTLTFTDGSSYTTPAIRGAKGETGTAGQNAYVHVKYSANEPTQDSDMKDTPDDWMGVYSGTSATAPTSYLSYKWLKARGVDGHQGVDGDPGEDASVDHTEYAYQVSQSGTVTPTGTWESTRPTVPQGSWLWTRTTIVWNDNQTTVLYNAERNPENATPSTLRTVPFSIGVNDWTLTNGMYTATCQTVYVTGSSVESVEYTSSFRDAIRGDLSWAKASGNGGITFTTDVAPVGTLEGEIRILDSDDGRTSVVLQGTVMPIANGGTGANTLAGAKTNLGIADLEEKIEDNDLAIIERGDTATHSIAEGKYVSWKGKIGKAKSAIQQGATLSSSLFDYDDEGALNALNASLTVVEKQYSIEANSVNYWGLRKWVIPYTEDVQKNQIIGYVITNIATIGVPCSLMLMSDGIWLTTYGSGSTESGSITIRFLLKRSI